MLCTDLTKISIFGRRFKAEPLRCKRWSCEHCRPRNQRRIRAMAIDGQPSKFVTLTSKPFARETPDQMARRMTDAWAKLIRLLKASFPDQELAFFRVLEAHKSGFPHMHILMRMPFLHQKRLSGMWRAVGGGIIADIRDIRGKKQAAIYVAKYLGKAPHKFKGCVRFYRSRNWSPSNDKSDYRQRADIVHVAREQYDQLNARAARFGSVFLETVTRQSIVLDWWHGTVLRC